MNYHIGRCANVQFDDLTLRMRSWALESLIYPWPAEGAVSCSECVFCLGTSFLYKFICNLWFGNGGICLLELNVIHPSRKKWKDMQNDWEIKLQSCFIKTVFGLKWKCMEIKVLTHSNKVLSFWWSHINYHSFM